MNDENFTRMLLDGIVRQLILPTVDQYGNQKQSPVDEAIRKWSEQNKAEIAQRVIDKISVDKLANKVADDIYSRMSAFGGSYSSYDKEKYKEELNKAITQKLAEKIVYKMEQEEKKV